jgi:hypothetical protein
LRPKGQCGAFGEAGHEVEGATTATVTAHNHNHNHNYHNTNGGMLFDIAVGLNHPSKKNSETRMNALPHAPGNGARNRRIRHIYCPLAEKTVRNAAE